MTKGHIEGLYLCGGQVPAYDPVKIRVNGAAGGPTDLVINWVFTWGTYNASSPGVHLMGIKAGSTVRVGYLDGGLRVTDSAEVCMALCALHTVRTVTKGFTAYTRFLMALS